MTVTPPVVFVHGLWLHSSSWQPWIDLFRDAGYGIDDVVEHYAALIAALPSRPILVGHSFGGMIAQKLLSQDRAAAAVAIDAAQIKGVLPLPLSALKATFPVFRNPTDKRRSVSLSAEQFRFAFGNAIPDDESEALPGGRLSCGGRNEDTR